MRAVAGDKQTAPSGQTVAKPWPVRDDAWCESLGGRPRFWLPFRLRFGMQSATVLHTRSRWWALWSRHEASGSVLRGHSSRPARAGNEEDLLKSPVDRWDTQHCIYKIPHLVGWWDTNFHPVDRWDIWHDIFLKCFHLKRDVKYFLSLVYTKHTCKTSVLTSIKTCTCTSGSRQLSHVGRATTLGQSHLSDLSLTTSFSYQSEDRTGCVCFLHRS